MGFGETMQHEGAVKVSAAESAEHESLLAAKRFVPIETNQQGRWEYNANGTVKYAGYAPKGLAEGSDGWLLHYFQYSGVQVTSRTIAYGNWTNRESESYE